MFDRRIEKPLDLGKSDDLVELLADLRPRHAEDRAVEIDILAAGQFRVKAGADFQQAGHAAVIVTRPAVGSVMRLRIFSSVLLPAPLRPMMPTTSPCVTSKETSRRAQKDSEDGGEGSRERGSGEQRAESGARSAGGEGSSLFALRAGTGRGMGT